MEACSISGTTAPVMERKISVVLRERTKRRGLLCSWCWFISNGRGLRLNKGIGSKVSGSVPRDSWSLEKKAGREPMQEKDSGAKDLPGAGEYAPL